MTDSQITPLSPFYYRDNFLRLCDTVEAQYGDILVANERELLHTFRSLTFDAQCLYIRLISRTGPWFRESKLHYSELGAIAAILDELLDCDMAAQATTLTTQDLGQLFTRRELKHIFQSLDHSTLTDKAALLSAIDALQWDAQQTLQALTLLDNQRIVAPLGVDFTLLLQILFFGNRHQSLTDFVLHDLGVTRYYPYTLDPEHRLFSCREALTEYLQCAELADTHFALLDTGEHAQLPALAQLLLSIEIRFSSSAQRWYRLCNNLARDLERINACTLALQLYGCSRHHPARERSARILERNGDWQSALDLCNTILDNPWCEAEHEAAERVRARAKRKLDGSRLPRKRDAFPQLTLSLPRGDSSVELQVATHLQQQWQAVHYVENTLMNALFGLAFWEQIFAAEPGVFHNPYQSVPADMYESAFYTQRADAIASRMTYLRQHNLATILSDAYQRYQQYECRWVHWRHISLELVVNCANVIPANHLFAIWERMLFDPAENRRGFPDLIALGGAVGEYSLIEVKGPGDALQDSQKRWLRYFQAQNIPTQVAWVEWRDD